MTTLQFSTIKFKLSRFAKYSAILAIALIDVCSLRAIAQNEHEHSQAAQEMSAGQQHQRGELLRIVRESTERFKDVSVAEAEGYALQFGCVTGDEAGAMGLHYVNASLVNNGVLDPTRPQIVIYEPVPGGGRKLIGADFLLIKDAWDKKHKAPPELMGQLFHLFNSPNRFGLPAFYTLHVWAWKNNPNGAFVNWHPNVACESFSGRN